MDQCWYRGRQRRRRPDGLEAVRPGRIDRASDDGQGDAEELLRLSAIAAQSDAVALVTHGVRPDLARGLADHLGLRHLPAPDRPRDPPE